MLVNSRKIERYLDILISSLLRKEDSVTLHCVWHAHTQRIKVSRTLKNVHFYYVCYITLDLPLAAVHVRVSLTCSYLDLDA